jgi:two-component system, sensor histidine kinase and response regulator
MVDERKIILIIDDEKVILLGISAMLRHEGFTVLTANNGQEGLAAIHEHQLDLIISDVTMPPPNGFELRQILSNDPDTATIPFIFVTARTSQGDKILGLEAGADDYITKPFDREELLARVNAVLRRNDLARKVGREEVKDEMERLRKEIVNNVSHELRTPIGILLNTLELTMKAKFDDPEEQQKYIVRALSNAYQIKSLIEDLLILTLIDENKLNTFRMPIDLAYDFQAPLQQCLNRYMEKKLDISIDIDPEVVIHAPKVEFRQAVLHVLDNACKFSSEGGKIAITLSPNGEGGCALTVKNQGLGISPVLREKVFDRFYQLSHGDARQFRGLGVGLTIARAIARSLGGDVKILDCDEGCMVSLTIAPAPSDWH